MSEQQRDPLQTDQSDPAMRRYLKPLADPEQEAMARSMADAIWGAVMDDLRIDGRGHVTTEQDFLAYSQALVDSRRMLRDPDYDALISGGGS